MIWSGLGALVVGSLLKMSLICLDVISTGGSCSGGILSKVVSTMFSISSESAVARSFLVNCVSRVWAMALDCSQGS